jgi:hypothetical protein
MLVELSVMEQRCHLVMEVVSETPVTEVACRYGVSRQAVHLWLGKYRRAGPPGMADHSRRPHFSSTPASPARVAHRRDQERVVEVVAVTFLFVARGAAVLRPQLPDVDPHVRGFEDCFGEGEFVVDDGLAGTARPWRRTLRSAPEPGRHCSNTEKMIRRRTHSRDDPSARPGSRGQRRRTAHPRSRDGAGRRGLVFAGRAHQRDRHRGRPATRPALLRHGLRRDQTRHRSADCL